MNYVPMCMRAHTHIKLGYIKAYIFPSLEEMTLERDITQKVEYVVDITNFIPVIPISTALHHYCMYCNI